MPIPIVQRTLNNGGYQASIPVPNYYTYNKTLYCCDPNAPHISDKAYADAALQSEITTMTSSASSASEDLQQSKKECIESTLYTKCIARKDALLDPYHYF